MSRTRTNHGTVERSQRRDHRQQRGAGTPGGPRRRYGLAAAGVLAVGVLLVGAVAVWLGQPGGAETGRGQAAAGDAFPIVAYQGAEVLGAEELDFGQLLGTGTPVVLNFWAGQCPPCRAEMPDFQRVYDRHEGEFLLVGVDIGPFVGLGSHESAEALLQELGISYPTAFAVDARAVRDNDVLGMPTTIFYDGAGVEVGRVSGLLSEEALEGRVRELVGAA
jgi:thiol-disulfide isomerase/thioredoxin